MELLEKSTLIEKLKAEKKSANDLQFRKHEDWNDNYELYRNKVKTNRLTQRQAVNIPLMKETIKTLLSKIDDPPMVDWKELSGDETKELLYQEMWDTNYRDNKLELVDTIDKKNVLLYGIATRKLNITSTGVSVEALDPFDVVFDPLMNVADIESARFIIHQNIFKSLKEILADDRYTEEGKNNLKYWLDSPAGITQGNDNKEKWGEKMERLKAMGVEHDDFALFAGGDRIVNLTEHFTNVWDSKGKKWQRRVYVYAENEVILLDESLDDLIGTEFWPFVTWVEDPETTDIYSDSVADLVRTPNKVVNVWYSQYIENRSLSNFGMHWYLPTQGFAPQTYTPGPGVMIPAPAGDDINKVIKPVEISGLEGTLDAINFLTNIVERGTGATAIEKGQPETGTQTLGEVEILVGKSVERAIGMAKLYRMAWHETCVKWDAMMHANAPKVLDLYKTARSGKVYPKRIYASDWKSEEGYLPIINSTSEQEQESMKSIQKFMFLLQQFPTNTALKKIAQKRMLESVDLAPEELRQVTEAEEQMQKQAMLTEQAQPQQPAPAEAPQPPADPNVMRDIEQSLAQLQPA